jgi:hypothetical protein
MGPLSTPFSFLLILSHLSHFFFSSSFSHYPHDPWCTGVVSPSLERGGGRPDGEVGEQQPSRRQLAPVDVGDRRGMRQPQRTSLSCRTWWHTAEMCSSRLDLGSSEPGHGGRLWWLLQSGSKQRAAPASSAIVGRGGGPLVRSSRLGPGGGDLDEPAMWRL